MNSDHPSSASIPTPATLRWRTFLPWQLVRFMIINIKMIRLLVKAHPHQPKSQ